MTGNPVEIEEFEVAVPVEDYLKLSEDAEEAFDRASCDYCKAYRFAREELRSILGKRKARSVWILDVTFIEFDSSNPTHAGAIFLVTIRGRDAILKKFLEAYDG
jgi:hypothetical protein